MAAIQKKILQSGVKILQIQLFCHFSGVSNRQSGTSIDRWEAVNKPVEARQVICKIVTIFLQLHI